MNLGKWKWISSPIQIPTSHLFLWPSLILLWPRRQLSYTSLQSPNRTTYFSIEYCLKVVLTLRFEWICTSFSYSIHVIIHFISDWYILIQIEIFAKIIVSWPHQFIFSNFAIKRFDLTLAKHFMQQFSMMPVKIPRSCQHSACSIL